MKKYNKKKRQQFSKVLLIQESVLVWITTLSFIVLAFLSIEHDFLGELGWLGAMVTSLWTAYGASQVFYYRKSQRENCRDGVTYLKTQHELGLKEETEDDEPVG